MAFYISMGRITMSRRKAQVWYTDFIIGLLIFIIALVIYYSYITNLSLQDKSLVDELFSDAKTISSSLISAGYPESWNGSGVERIGLTNGNQRINNTKLSEFSAIPYKDSRRLFGTRFDYFMFFENKNDDILMFEGKCGIGHPSAGIDEACEDVFNLQNISYTKLVKIERFVVYNSNIAKMVIYVWQ